jgi:lysophospholipase L1-like esterase
VELEDYRANMDGVITHAKGIKHCSVSVVTTTPVLEALHQASRDYDRLNADVDAYNAVLCDLADRHGLPVIDLHSAIAGGPAERLISHDGVHLNDAGRLAAASALAKTLRPRVDEALGLSGWDAEEAAVQNSLSFRLE